MPSRPASYYVQLGERALLTLLAREHAVVWHEVEAKLADRPGEGLPHRIDPHNLTIARRNLLDKGLIEEHRKPTRGGRIVPVTTPADTSGRKRAIEAAAGRKRILQARYLSWASGSQSGGEGIIGPAAEAVVHASLTAAAPYGYRLLNPSRGEVRRLFDAPVPGGPPDNGAFLTLVDPQTNTVQGSYVMLVEVKNIRSWIYPGKSELHQLLDKAARLQLAHPDIRFLPVLVCRRVSYLTYQMAEQIGFYALAMRRQYIRPHVADPDPTHLNEVRDELGYDLEPWDGPVDPMVGHFTTHLQRVAARTADRWAESAPVLSPFSAVLRQENLREPERARTVNRLADAARQQLTTEQTWHSEH